MECQKEDQCNGEGSPEKEEKSQRKRSEAPEEGCRLQGISAQLHPVLPLAGEGSQGAEYAGHISHQCDDQTGGDVSQAEVCEDGDCEGDAEPGGHLMPRSEEGGVFSPLLGALASLQEPFQLDRSSAVGQGQDQHSGGQEAGSGNHKDYGKSCHEKGGL